MSADTIHFPTVRYYYGRRNRTERNTQAQTAKGNYNNLEILKGFSSFEAKVFFASLPC